MKRRIDYILKHNLMIQKIYKVTVSYFFKILGFFLRIDSNILLFNGHGNKYNDSPKEIFELLIKNSENSNFKIYWALDDPGKYTIDNCKKIKIDTLKYFVIALKAKYWIACVNIERGLHFKKKKTIYLNTWHGTPLKYVGNAVKGRKDFNFSKINYFCSAGEYESKIYINDFKVSEKSIINSGLPRNDILYNYDLTYKNQILEKLGLPLDKKIILYAPTWRDSDDFGKSYSIKPPIDYEKWKMHLNNKYIVLMRAHSYTNSIYGVHFDGFIRDFSNYDVVNDLIIVSDLLISDYSAMIFDYSITEKPIICYGYDYDKYKKDRGLYLDLQTELPNGVVKTEDDLLSLINNMNYDEQCQMTKLFKNKYLRYGGNASEILVEKIFNRNNQKA